MAGKTTIQVQGLADVRRRLQGARIGLSGPLQDALVVAAKTIRSEAERLAPRGETGNLKRSLRASPGRATKTFLQSFVFTLGQIAPHAHLIEYGTKPHSIIPKKNGGIMAFGRFFVRKVQHPGVKPWPFFQMAVRNKRAQVRRIVTQAVQQVTARLNAQAG